jgi:hypothetical protein
MCAGLDLINEFPKGAKNVRELRNGNTLPPNEQQACST